MLSKPRISWKAVLFCYDIYGVITEFSNDQSEIRVKSDLLSLRQTEQPFKFCHDAPKASSLYFPKNETALFQNVTPLSLARLCSKFVLHILETNQLCYSKVCAFCLKKKTKLNTLGAHANNTDPCLLKHQEKCSVERHSGVVTPALNPNTKEAKWAKTLCPHYFPFPPLLILCCALIGHRPCQPSQVGFSPL